MLREYRGESNPSESVDLEKLYGGSALWDARYFHSWYGDLENTGREKGTQVEKTTWGKAEN